MNQSTVEYYYKNILLAISSFVSTKKDLELTYKYKKHHINSFKKKNPPGLRICSLLRSFPLLLFRSLFFYSSLFCSSLFVLLLFTLLLFVLSLFHSFALCSFALVALYSNSNKSDLLQTIFLKERLEQNKSITLLTF